MADSFRAKSSIATIPPPPRATGNAEVDARALTEWTNNFYTAAVIESGLLDPEYQASGSDEVDYSKLPDPTATTIARAQQVANTAIRRSASGFFTISDTNSQATVEFDAPLEDENYHVTASPTAFTGSPAVGAFSIAAVSKSASGIGVALAAAPGAGTSVTFDFIVLKTL